MTADGVEVLGAGLDGSTATYFLGECAPGCTDEAACNYDADAPWTTDLASSSTLAVSAAVPVWTPMATACATRKKLRVAR